MTGGEGEKMNPFHSIVRQFNEDDLVIVKLDIDTPRIEQEMFRNFVKDESLHKLVDHFYFEDHARIHEMRFAFGKSFAGLDVRNEVNSVQQSMELMNTLRKNGVAAHYWV